LKDISTLDFSTPSFNPKPQTRTFQLQTFQLTSKSKKPVFHPGLFNHEFLNHGVEKFLFEKSGVEMSLKGPGLKLRVEKSGVEIEMSFNQLAFYSSVSKLCGLVKYKSYFLTKLLEIFHEEARD
jgi:hypothetical protein